MSWRSEYPDLARTIDQLSARVDAHEKKSQPNTRRRGRPPGQKNGVRVAETAQVVEPVQEISEG